MKIWYFVAVSLLWPSNLLFSIFYCNNPLLAPGLTLSFIDTGQNSSGHWIVHLNHTRVLRTNMFEISERQNFFHVFTVEYFPVILFQRSILYRNNFNLPPYLKCVFFKFWKIVAGGIIILWFNIQTQSLMLHLNGRGQCVWGNVRHWKSLSFFVWRWRWQLESLLLVSCHLST